MKSSSLLRWFLLFFSLETAYIYLIKATQHISSVHVKKKDQHCFDSRTLYSYFFGIWGAFGSDPLRGLSFCFRIITIHPHLGQIIEVSSTFFNISWEILTRFCFCSSERIFGSNLAEIRNIFKSSFKIFCTEPKEMFNSLKTFRIVNRRFDLISSRTQKMKSGLREVVVGRPLFLSSSMLFTIVLNFLNQKCTVKRFKRCNKRRFLQDSL